MTRARAGAGALLAALLLVPITGRAQAQNATITGKVTSDAARPLEGATVSITELTLMTTTNAQGEYTLTIPSARVNNQSLLLRVRAIGYAPESKPVTIRAGSQSTDFTLKQDITRLAEVVSTGVAEGTERAKLPFTVASVNVGELPAAATDPLTQIQGRVPGVNIVHNSGRPGAEASVILRAPASINASGRGQEPLYVVDGIVLNQGLIDLNSADIETIEIVKGAAAASLYGARAGNGVIQVTTRRGLRREGLRFGTRAEYGVNDIEHTFALAENHIYLMTADGSKFCKVARDCSQTFDWVSEVLKMNSTANALPNPPGAAPLNNGTTIWNTFQIGKWPGQTYNALDQVIKPGPFSQADANVSGRNGNTNFFGSLGYLHQSGSFIGLTGFERGSARLNLDQRVGDAWNVQFSTFYSRSSSDGVGQEGNSFFDLTRMPRGVDLLMKDTVRHEYIIRPDLQGENENPIYTLVYQDRYDVTDRFLGGMNVQYQPTGWFDVRANASYDRANNRFDQFNDKGFRTSRSASVNLGQVFKASSANQSWNGNISATARHDFRPDVRTSLQARYSFEQQDLENANATGRDLAVKGVPDLDNARSPQIFVTSGVSSIRRIGYFLNGTADVKDKYYVDGLVRRDGSSLFGPDNRWATFGRLGASWRMSQESWFNVPKVDELKLRYAVGTAGNSPSFTAQYEVYQLAGGSFAPTTLGNRELGPERLRETEMGADVSLFGKLAATVTYSNVVTKDQILPVPLTAAAGFATQWQNAGTMEGKTWEFSAEVPWISKPDMSLSTRFTFDRSRATITELSVAPFTYGTADQNLDGVFYAREGERYGTIYGTRWATSCSDLPKNWTPVGGTLTALDCSKFATNSDGYLVYTNGLGVGSGVTLDASGKPVVTAGTWGTTGPVMQGRTGGVPWGTALIAQDSVGNQFLPLGNALPDYRWGFNPNFSYKRMTATALFDASVGRSVYNQARQWSYFEAYSHDQDQSGKPAELIKPQGYYGSAPGLYNVLGANSHFVEDGSFTKLREMTLSYHIGTLRSLSGDWSATLIGRNLKTWTKYKGWDPEVGRPGGQSSSGVINAFDAFSFPNLRTFSFALQATF